MGGQRTLGINGLGRIGKLVLWYQLARDDFDRIVVNVGRPVGTSLESVVQYIAKDSTYGPLHRFLHGQAGVRDMRVIDEQRGLIGAYGKEIVVLREARSPKDIPWRDNGVSLVVECTGTFRDPHAEPDAAKGSLRGHLAAGARTVVVSSPFSSKLKGVPLPDDSTILIHGINDYQFDAAEHRLVSAASCTTTALAHMMRPLLERDLTRNMITAGMSTVHAATNSQPLLDAVPAAGATDLRKTRGALGNVVLTSTNAAAALEQVMPEIARIGFMADSVRIPTASVSLIILNVTFQNEALPDGTVAVERRSSTPSTRRRRKARRAACSSTATSRTCRSTCWARTPPWSSKASRPHAHGLHRPRSPLGARLGRAAARCACRSPTSRSSAGTTTRWAATPPSGRAHHERRQEHVAPPGYPRGDRPVSYPGVTTTTIPSG